MIRSTGYLIAVLCIVSLLSCNNDEKKPLNVEDTVEITDFIEFYPDMVSPFVFGDTLLSRKQADSTAISQKVFARFVPDSLLSRVFGKGAKTKYYPVARITGTNKETFLVSNGIAGTKKITFVTALNKKNEVLSVLPMLTLDASSATQQQAGIDKKGSVTKIISRKNPDESFSQGQDVFAFDATTGAFTLAMTDALDDQEAELINPIDSFSRKQKFTGDYGSGKNNLVSVRDGRRPNSIRFFIHFERNNGDCQGELKGEALLVDLATAEYRENGDPCVLQFKFAGSSVTLKEVEGCGSRRDLRCSYDGVYPRKKTPAVKPPAKKKK